MQLSIGYQLGREEGERFADLVSDYREQVAEVYFAWSAQPSGRPPLARPDSAEEKFVQDFQIEDLRALRAMGVRLNLLFNANCYGGNAAGRRLQDEVMRVLDRLAGALGGPVETVTTTSLAVARTVKRAAPAIDVRASVNMRLGTVQALSYVAGLFDSYCVQRDCNRDLERLAELRAWADAHGKRLSLLANSGCLAFCSGQTFHDNLVAHAAEACEAPAIPDWDPTVCGHLMRRPEEWPRLLQATWIRPEDLHHYDALVPLVKLATRTHENPRMVVHAYADRRFRGNLLNLLEPSHALALAPAWIDNDAFPPDWFARTSQCDRRCHCCGYCAEVLGRVLRVPTAERPQNVGVPRGASPGR